MPNKWRTIKSLVHEFVFTVDEGKERLNPSREKNIGMHRRRKVDEKFCVTPAGTSNELDVQNKWDENTHTRQVVLSTITRKNIQHALISCCNLRT